MLFKIGQPMITIMNIFNIIVKHTIKIFKYHPPCRQMCPLHFAPPIIPLIYVHGHNLNSNVSLNLDASLSLIPAMDVPGIAKLHVL